MKINSKTTQLALMGMFTAIILILTFTQYGFIPLPFIKATIMHIPVIIGAILLGPGYGAMLGFMFGAASLYVNSIAPGTASFVFSPFIPVPGTDQGSYLSLIICFLPRILVGVVPWYVYRGLKKLYSNKFIEPVWLAIAGVFGSLTNTLPVMHLIYFLFKDSYAVAKKVAVDAVYGFILGVIATNGVFEAIAAAVIVAAICGAVMMTKKTRT